MNIEELTLAQIKEIQSMTKPSKRRPPLSGRAILVVDRGWIFAGDMSRTADGYVRLENAVNVFGWDSIGFARIAHEWKSDKVDLRPCEPVEVPEDAIVFRQPVPPGWGLK